MKTFPKTVLGDFININFCTKCNWFRNPENYKHYTLFDICPKCGNECTETVGRFVFLETKRWFGVSSKCVGVLKGKRKVIKLNGINMIYGTVE